ncbi:LysR family transcriptional regulator [Chromobacterium phragmitis]|uniref:LysR family transcriptional regulator n=1 Tax=Chromobacterium phragmitis TaxID=2202141 RepID=UPI000DEC174E|nr:LysR family transcriptional regulator [Chromobacterium phragmitis]AXE29685.1 LysR family transcriptional regulator [Chromobacterium phragmitis]
MNDLNDLYYYAQVVECGGFAAAGRKLCMPKSKLSRHVAALEARLEVRLIQRSTRHFIVTEAGQMFYERCKAMLTEAEAALEAISALKSEPRGLIRLTCPIGLLHMHAGAMLADFMALHPHISVQLEASNRRVDVMAEGIDVAIRVRPPPLEDSGLVMRVLSDRGQCLVASPELVARHAPPLSPADLQGWPSVIRSSPQKTYHWQLHGPRDQVVMLHHAPRLVTTDMPTLRHAALRGIGIAQLPLLMVQQDIDAGRLIRLLPDWPPRREIIHLVFPSRRGLLPVVRALIDYLAERYAALEED